MSPGFAKVGGLALTTLAPVAPGRDGVFGLAGHGDLPHAGIIVQAF